MFHSCKFEFKKPPLLKKGVGVKNTYTAIASTPSLDRHKEVLVPRGVMTEKFMTNPVMLNIHDHRNLPVGKVTNIRVTKEDVQFDFQFADTEEGNKIEKLYNSGFMNAFSVGFIPKAYVDLFDVENVTSLEVELPSGEKELIDLTKYAEKPYGIISKWELLEISPVPIPANPDAVLIRAKDEIVRKFVDAGNSKAAVSLLERQLSERVSEIQKDLDSLLDSAKEDEVKLSYAVPYQACELRETEWNVEEAKSALVIWSSTDKEHAGDDGFMDWGKFAKGFGWVDVERADKWFSYCLAHHAVEGDQLYVVWGGLTNAMADLLEDKTLADAKDVYAHLAQHYADFGKVAPEFDRDYTEDELVLIREGKELQVLLQVTYSESEESADESGSGSESPDDSTNSLSAEVVKELITSGFAGLKAQVADLESVLRLRMNILGKLVDDLHKDIVAIKDQPKVEEPKVVEDSEEAKLLLNELRSLSSVFADIRGI